MAFDAKNSCFIAGFEIDARIESHTFTAEVTKFPVESGAAIVDHVRNLPRAITLDCTVSNTPFGPLRDRRSADTLPADDALATLQIVYEERQPITIECALGVLRDMVVSSISIPVTAETGDALRFTLSAEQVKIVTNERTTIRTATPSTKAKSNIGNAPSKKIGDFESTPKAAEAARQDKSLLYSLKEALL